MSVLGLYAIAVAEQGGSALGPVMIALGATLATNLYIVGLNQLTDVEIDTINKPDLPLVSGALTQPAGWRLVLGGLVIGVLLAGWGGPYLLGVVAASAAIGTAYSLPPVRLKRFAFWAAACIFTVRGVLVNLLLYLHFDRVLGGVGRIPASVWALTAFVFGLALVIAWLKDVPDTEGDRAFGIGTLAIRLGARRVIGLGVGLLLLCYVGLMAVALAGLPGVNAPVLVVSHLVLAAIALALWKQVDPARPASVRRFYLSIWGLFFAEYAVYPVACLLG